MDCSRISLRRNAALALVLTTVLALAVLACASCGRQVVRTSTQPGAGTTTAPGAASGAAGGTARATPGGIPPHMNAAQLERVDRSKHDFTFAVLGDNRGSTTVFPTLISRVNSDNVLFALDNGDLVDSGTAANYRLFLGQIASSTRPFLTAIGNHEDEQGYQALFGDSYYDFAVGNSLFIVLDDSNGKDIDGAQLEWLKTKLAAGQSYKFRFVFMHVPLYDPRVGLQKAGHSLNDLGFARTLNDLFDANHVTLLLTSHIHGYYEGVWGSTPYIITGGAGGPLQGSDPAHFFNHYVRVHVSDQGESYEVVKI
jgi:serine/threonine-protein phosphatase CPPED1